MIHVCVYTSVLIHTHTRRLPVSECTDGVREVASVCVGAAREVGWAPDVYKCRVRLCTGGSS